MRDYLADFLTPDAGEVLKSPISGKAQKAQKSLATFENTQGEQGSKGSKGTFEPFDTYPHGGFSKVQQALANENPEMHDSALFDVIVEVDFYDGRRIRILQQSTPAGWASPF